MQTRLGSALLLGALWASVMLASSVSRAEISDVVDYNDWDRANPAFQFQHAPQPSQTDVATYAKSTIFAGERDENGGSVDVLHDGKLPSNENQPASNFFLSAGREAGRLAELNDDRKAALQTEMAALPNRSEAGDAGPVEVIWKAWFSGDRTNAATLVLEALKTPPGDLQLLRGMRSYGWEEPHRLAEALPLLDLVVQLDHPSSWRSSWALVTAAWAHYGLGNYNAARTALESSLELKGPPETVAFALEFQRLLGFSPLNRDWPILETAHFRFHFSPDVKFLNAGRFARKHETYFETINQFFHAELPKKIDYFVWRGQSAWAKPSIALIKAHRRDRGHEMTHVLCQHACQSIQTSSLVDEGIAVYFDQSGSDRLKTAQRAIRGAKWATVSIPELWQERGFWKNQYVSYRVAGAVVERLRSKGGDAKLKALLREQTLEAAHRIYGPELDNWLNELGLQLQKGTR